MTMTYFSPPYMCKLMFRRVPSTPGTAPKPAKIDLSLLSTDGVSHAPQAEDEEEVDMLTTGNVTERDLHIKLANQINSYLKKLRFA